MDIGQVKLESHCLMRILSCLRSPGKGMKVPVVKKQEKYRDLHVIRYIRDPFLDPLIGTRGKIDPA